MAGEYRVSSYLQVLDGKTNSTATLIGEKDNTRVRILLTKSFLQAARNELNTTRLVSNSLTPERLLEVVQKALEVLKIRMKK